MKSRHPPEANFQLVPTVPTVQALAEPLQLKTATQEEEAEARGVVARVAATRQACPISSKLMPL